MHQIDKDIRDILKRAREKLNPLSFSQNPVYDVDTLAYFRYYGLDISIDAGYHYVGTVPSGNQTLCVHVFYLPNARGTVWLLHGYFDHSGMMVPLIRLFLAHRFTVGVFDYPGHGLSSGPRSSISDFSAYRIALRDILDWCEPIMVPPMVLVGHSTGGAVALEYMLACSEGYPGHRVSFDKSVLLAPLVRSGRWGLVRFGHDFFQPFISYIPRPIRDLSSDKDFMAFVRNDPLQERWIPVQWVSALIRWNQSLDLRPTLSGPVLVVQGTRDDVVDWRYNLPYLQKKIRKIHIIKIKGAMHQLVHESQPYQRQVFAQISRFVF